MSQKAGLTLFGRPQPSRLCIEPVRLSAHLPIAGYPIGLLVPTQAGLHCPSGAFYIDPVRPVARALVTHAHSDHARSGHEAVLATAETLDLMRLRYGEDFAGTTQAVGYGETVRLDGVSITFHPAGHVPALRSSWSLAMSSSPRRLSGQLTMPANASEILLATRRPIFILLALNWKLNGRTGRHDCRSHVWDFGYVGPRKQMTRLMGLPTGGRND
jgi:hypothetical protein